MNLRSHLLNRSEADLIFNFALDFTARYADGTAISEILPVAAEGEVLRQRIRLDGLPATVLRVRQPHWANAVTAAVPTWPTTIGALKAQGLEPFSAALRGKECCFVTGPLSLAVYARPVRGTSPIICSEFRN